MNQAVMSKLELFVSNTQSTRSDFAWQDGMVRRMMALVFTLEGREIDANVIKDARDMIRAETRMFSRFRGMSQLPVAAKLALTDDPKRLFKDVQDANQALRDAGFPNSDLVVIASYLLASGAEHFNYKKYADLAFRYWGETTSRAQRALGFDDSVYMVMMALADIDSHDGIKRINELTERLRPEFRWASASAVHDLASVLAIGGKSDEALDCLLGLNEALRAQKIRLDKEHTLPALGMLSLLNLDRLQLVDDLIAGRDFLREQKGFKVVDSQELLMQVSALIAATACDGEDGSKKLLGGAVAQTVITQQIIVMMMIVIMTSTMAASAAAVSG